jgi:nuclear cap-binding protein subunit 1
VVRVRKQLVALAESPLKRVEDEMGLIARTVSDNYEDEELREGFYDLVLQLVAEQPFKIPFVAAVVLQVNVLRSEMCEEVLRRAGERVNTAVAKGEWREVKLLMKFLGGLQGIFEGEGLWVTLQDFLTKALDLQTENNEEVSCVGERRFVMVADMNRIDYRP